MNTPLVDRELLDVTVDCHLAGEGVHNGPFLVLVRLRLKARAETTYIIMIEPDLRGVIEQGGTTIMDVGQRCEEVMHKRSRAVSSRPRRLSPWLHQRHDVLDFHNSYP